MSSNILVGWERAMMASEKVKERLRRATNALDQSRIPYAVAGGNAVAEWVGRVDDEAVRTTRDVDLLIRRVDFQGARAALEAKGFVYHHIWGVDTFVDGPLGKPSAGVHLLFAGENGRDTDEYPTPDVEESEPAAEFQVLSLLALVRMKLVAWRDKDRTHLRDMISVGLIDVTWVPRLPRTLDERLQQLINDPNG